MRHSQNFADSMLRITILLLAASLLLAGSAPAELARTIIAPLGENPGDRFGFSVGGLGDVNGDGWPDMGVGAADSQDGGVDVGRAYVFFGGPAADDVPDLTIAGPVPEGHFGTQIVAAGNVNGDLYDDFLVRGDSTYLFLGGDPPDATPDLVVPLGNEASWERSIGTAGDINDDGYDDFLGDAGSGVVHVHYGAPALDTIVDLTLVGASGGFGLSVSAAGDVNDDGYDDFIVGSPYEHGESAVEAGKAYVYYGGATPDSTADVVFTGDALDHLGMATSNAGDLDGDGYDDVLVAAIGENDVANEGIVNVFLGGDPPDASVDLRFSGISPGDRFGEALSAAGDVNGDDLDDFVVGGRRGLWTLGEGRVSVFFGAAVPDSVPDIVWYGAPETWRIGKSVAGVGDWNGDGLDDVLSGAPSDSTVGVDAGRAWLLGGCHELDFELTPIGPLTQAVPAPNQLVEFRFLLENSGCQADTLGLGLFDRTDPGWFWHLDVRGICYIDSVDLAYAPAQTDTVLVGVFPTSDGTGTARLRVVSRTEPDSVESYVVTLHVDPTVGVGGEVAGAPGKLRIETIAPNPTRGAVDVVWSAPRRQAATMTIYDVAGRRVRTIVSGIRAPGRHRTTWSGLDDAGRVAPAGVYFCRLTSGEAHHARRIVRIEGP